MIKRLYSLCGAVMIAAILIGGATYNFSVFAQFPSLVAELQTNNNVLYTRVTTSTDSNRGSYSPLINSDGTKIVFISDSDLLGEGLEDNDYELWLYDITTMTYTRITTANTISFNSFYPAINDDGTKIAYHSNADPLGEPVENYLNQVWLYDTTTMTYTRITPLNTAGWGASINSDGTKIAFTSNSSFLGEEIENGQYEIWLYDTITLTHTRITTSTPSGRYNGDVVINSDGTKIVFRSDSDFLGEGIEKYNYEIWLYDTDTMTYTRITNTIPPYKKSLDPQINHDGTKIVFWSESDLVDNEVWLYDTNVMSLTRITTSTSPFRGSLNPVINSDGTKIVFTSDSDLLGEGLEDNSYELWLYDTNTMTYTHITTSTEFSRNSFNHDPTINHDGTKIVFRGDSDFLGEGIARFSNQIWLWEDDSDKHYYYLPITLK